jgi:hypothetical protein
MFGLQVFTGEMDVVVEAADTYLPGQVAFFWANSRAFGEIFLSLCLNIEA